MIEWIIEPRDPLIARDGRPAAVNHLETLRFPFPSMLAGAVRTRMASPEGTFLLSGPGELNELKQKVTVRGPLLAELAADDSILQWLPPAPRDAVLSKIDDKHVAVRRLLPRPLKDGEAMDALPKAGLWPVFLAGPAEVGKPPEKLPAFWTWEQFETWLLAPQDQPSVELVSLGIENLPKETRVHLALQPGERVHIDGMLFQTSGLRFLQEKDPKHPLSPRRFALSVQCQGGTVAGRELALHEQTAPLGGERRLASWRRSPQAWPALPEAIREKVAVTGRARLVLLTPALFEDGALPGWNGKAWPLGGPVVATVRAACVGRPEIVSGWDLAAENKPGQPKGRPKPTRRLAGAGSVYFLELSGSEDDRRRWCEKAWLACVSDGEQDRRDGFGMGVVGTWEDNAS